MTYRMSVVIPAHNEAVIVGALVGRLVAEDPDELIEIVVVANGCTDDTAAAAAVDPRVRVVEIDAASKIAALNRGDAEATTLPRAYVDADVSVSAAALLALADELSGESGAHVASPTFRVDLTRSNWFVRQHYLVWQLSQYRVRGHIGSGIYALSAVGRSRFREFPDVIADDRFVQQLFAPEERATLAAHEFIVRAPNTLSAQIRRATRIQVGNRQLAAALPSGVSATGGTDRGSLLRRVARRPRLWPALVVYAFGYSVPRLAARRVVARGGVMAWNRDESSRV